MARNAAEGAGFLVVTYGCWELDRIAGIFVAGVVLLWYGNRG